MKSKCEKCGAEGYDFQIAALARTVNAVMCQPCICAHDRWLRETDMWMELATLTAAYEAAIQSGNEQRAVATAQELMRARLVAAKRIDAWLAQKPEPKETP